MRYQFNSCIVTFRFCAFT